MRQPEIDYDPQSSDARRERTERAVLSRVAAIQALGESDAVLASSPPKYRWLALGFAGAAVAAAILFFVMRGDSHVVTAESPSLVQTPVGGTSQFTVGDSVIDAGSDTRVQVKREASGAITLVLARGSIDCQVSPRAGRPPFRVVAGDVTVEVVGTRFSVTYTQGSVRVDVAHGKVRVKSSSEERVLEAGGSWTPGKLAAAEPTQAAAPSTASEQPAQIESDETESAASEPAPIEMPAEQAAPRATATRTSSRAAFTAAQRLESTDPKQAAVAYRAIANGKDLWASLALYALAELHATSDARSALRELDELAKKFPNNPNAEDAAWLRVDVLRKLGRDDDARKAAGTYLRDYPKGTYVKAATRLASP